MDTRELAKIDLNLLIALQILLEEKNVSRAAERLFITQPAMRKTLSRLRQVFDDALFTRSGHGMQPTPRATELEKDLAAGVASRTVVKLNWPPSWAISANWSPDHTLIRPSSAAKSGSRCPSISVSPCCPSWYNGWSTRRRASASA